MTRKPTGWKKDPRDERDALRAKAPYRLPAFVDLSSALPYVRNQGNLGSCVGFGIGGNLAGCALQQQAYTEWFSPAWIYNGARMLEGTLRYDDGCYPRNALKFINDYGCLLERFRPYKDTLDITSPVTWGLIEESGKWPIVSYERCVDGVDGLCAALAAGHLVSIGTPWFESWNDTDSRGIMSDNYTSVSGGHEYLAYGYDRDEGLFYCQNSWGNNWGVAGRFAFRFSAIDAFKQHGGYDAHIITVNWGLEPDPEPNPNDEEDGMDKQTKIGIWIVVGAAVLFTAWVLFAFHC
jgi:C1A family cysteine protease